MLVDVGGDKRRDHSLALLRSAVCQYTVIGAEVPVLSGSLEWGRRGEEREGGRRGERGSERGKERGREESEGVRREREESWKWVHTRHCGCMCKLASRGRSCEVLTEKGKIATYILYRCKSEL